MEDSLGERVWVDRPDCKMFTDNIQSAFGTKMPRSVIAPLDVLKADFLAVSAGAFWTTDTYMEGLIHFSVYTLQLLFLAL